MPSYTIGLDLGQTRDFSALAVVERVDVLPGGLGIEHYQRRLNRGSWTERPREELHVRHLQRWQVGTPYPAVVR